MKPLPEQYDHKETEKRWQEHWQQQKTYAWDPAEPRANNYVIDTPPPTVSGLLHMGHIFSYTQADFVARFQRMIGKNVFYPMGFDDNGLPTERLVEKTINKKAGQMTREEFIKECEKVVKDAEDEFRKLFKSAALSVDWDQEYQTISAESRKLSQMSFLDLYKKQEVYRQLQPMLWDPVDQTAIAQAEIVDKEIDSFWNDIYFGVDGSEEKITIGTTRPELIPACVAVFYHPDDERYNKKLKGKIAITPLFGVKVPILPDDEVKMDKGTGLVMCCTFGDEMDINWWRKQKLKEKIILNKYGKLDAELLSEAIKDSPLKEILAGKKVNNSDPKNPGAREIILEEIKKQNLLVKQDKIKHAVKCAERSGAPLEILPTHQWFVKVLDKKENLKKKANECNWNPDFMRIRIEQWIDGLNWDWCISRQRYFGVPFPIWYSKRKGEEGKILIADKDSLPINPLVDLPKGYTKDEVEPDKDVMDTWATSSVSPQLSSKGINKDFCIDNARHEKLFPADLRPQAHEIIRTWAFYTIVKAYLHEKTIPWKNLMISGWCLAADKTKMSKSKGNVVTPVALIEEKGTDAVRYWASTSRLGADTAFSEDLLKIGKKLVNKLWNASKFAAIHLDKVKNQKTAAEDVKSGVINETLDLWILTRLQKTITKATKDFSEYEYCDARVATEDFFWKDFCDNYLEMVKVRAYDEKGENPKGQLSAAHTIYHCLDGILRLFAPFVPHITEELYSHIFESKNSIHKRGNWPIATNYPVNEQAEKTGIAAVSILEAVRKIKAEQKVSIKTPITNLYVQGEAGDVKKMEKDIAGVTSSLKIHWQKGPDNIPSVKSEDGAFTVSAEISKADAA